MNKKYKGKVIRGDGLAGPEYDTPTANLNICPMDLQHGVYAAYAFWRDTKYGATVCYGACEPAKFEVHLLDFDGELIGEELDVEILELVSELVPWESKERMRQKILHDLQITREIFANKK